MLDFILYKPGAKVLLNYIIANY